MAKKKVKKVKKVKKQVKTSVGEGVVIKTDCENAIQDWVKFMFKVDRHVSLLEQRIDRIVDAIDKSKKVRGL